MQGYKNIFEFREKGSAAPGEGLNGYDIFLLRSLPCVALFPCNYFPGVMRTCTASHMIYTPIASIRNADSFVTTLVPTVPSFSQSQSE